MCKYLIGAREELDDNLLDLIEFELIYFSHIINCLFRNTR